METLKESFTPVIITNNQIIPLDQDVAIPLRTVEISITKNSIAIVISFGFPGYGQIR